MSAQPAPSPDDTAKAPEPRPLIEIPVGGSVELERAFPPGAKRDPARAASAQSGFIVRERGE